jgi:hypothetical protein
VKAHHFVGDDDSIRPATYRPYFFEALGLYVISGALCAFLLWGTFHARTRWDAALALLMAACIAALALLIRFRFRVQVGDDGLTARGFSRSHSIRWTQIDEVICLGGRGMRGCGFYGPQVYAFRGEGKAVVINFKLFSRECCAVIFGKIKRLSLKVTYPKPI